MNAVNPGPAAEQMAASQPATSAWVSASAGSGKTSVLIDRIVRLLLTGGREESGVSPERLLCVTFTNAAAAEMRNRLFARLGRWAVIPDDALNGELSALGCVADESDEDALAALRERARLLFARALETPGGLKIQTIHGFCDRLLRQFPLEAGVAVNFRILDERAEQVLRRQAREQVLQRALYAGPDDPLGAAVREISLHVDDNGFTRLLEKTAAIHDARRLLPSDGVPDEVEKAIAAIYGTLGVSTDETAESVSRQLHPPAEEESDWQAASTALVNGGGKQDQVAALAIWNFFNLPRTDLSDIDSWLNIFFTKAMAPRKKLAVKRVADGSPDVYRRLLAEQARLETLLARRRALTVAQRSAALLRVMQALGAGYDALKRGRGFLDYDDLVDRAGALLTRSKAAAWVLYKLDGGLDHILVDEAQDTSPGQWRVIRSLAAEFFSGDSARDAARTFFAVGDEKQSIFSFQGADLNEFAAMRTRFGEDAAGARKDWAHVRLDRSWRSTPEILTAVDSVFAGHAGSLSLSAPSVAHKPVRGESGVVELWPPESPAAENDDGDSDTEPAEDNPWDAPLDYIPADSPRACLARRIADRIGGWLATGERLSSGRVITPGDVMILVRRRDALVTEMVRALKSAGIPVAGADRMVLMEQLAAQDLMALGRFALLPDDDLTLASVLKGPLCGLDDGALFSLAHERRGSLWRALRGSRAFAETAAFLSDVRRRARWQAPFAFYAGILAVGGRRNLLARLGVEAEEVIDEFVTLAMEYGRINTPCLEGFLHWLSTDEVQIKRDADQGRDEVRILTVHAAKGLESPIVFLPDTCAMPSSRRHESPLLPLAGPDGPLAWTTGVEGLEPVDESRERAEQARHDENLRLFYVAMTRARDRLYICGHHGRRGMAAGCWHELAGRALTPLMTDHDTDDGPVRRLAGTTPPPESATSDMVPPPAAPLPTWAHTPAPMMPVTRIVAPSRLEERSPADPTAATRGILIHRLLETLPDCAPSQRAETARAFLKTAAPELDESARESLVARVMAVLDSPDCARLFGPGSRAEVPVAGRVTRGDEESAWDVHGRIDRLVVGEEILAVDYKSARNPPRDVESVSRGDMGQMAVYRAVLRGVWPDRPVRCGLLWVEEARLMVLPDAALDDSLTRLAQTR